jgi:alpha-amylase
MANSLFQQPAFLRNSNIYEVNIRQYSPEGTFSAFAAHLPRLKDMGVEILWLMPVHPIGEMKRKGTLGSYYSIKDFMDINPEFGTKDDFHNLVQHAHTLGFKVIIDWVANHTSWDHVWTTTNPEYFLHNADNSFAVPFDWDDVIQLDHKNGAQQQAMMQAMKYWITDFDIDGFRADMAHLTPLQFWKDARTYLSPLKKDLIWLAETEDISYHEAFDISYSWEWMHKTEKYFKGEVPFAELIDTLGHYRNDFPFHALHLFFTSNHDENSWNGTEYEKYGDFAKALAVFDTLYDGVPLIYSGQELPNNKRLQFFEKNEIEWTDNMELHAFYKILYSLRSRYGAVSEFTYDQQKLLPDGFNKNMLAFSSKKNEAAMLVFINLGKYETVQNYIVENISGKFRNIFTDEELLIDRNILIKLKSAEYAVFEKI